MRSIAPALRRPSERAPRDPAWPLRPRAYPPITELVAEVVATRGSATLLEQGGRRWSYADLGERAEEFADALQTAHHAPKEVVAITTSRRGFDLYAALLGTWLACGVPLVLDTALPAARQRLMLHEARVRTLLTLDEQAAEQGDRLVGDRLARVAVENGEQGHVRRRLHGSVPARRAVGSRDPAYVFFTSGSTGAPKAFVGSHNGLSHMLLWQRKEFGIDEHDRCAQVISLRADAVLRDIFTPVITGAIPRSCGWA